MKKKFLIFIPFMVFVFALMSIIFQYARMDTAYSMGSYYVIGNTTYTFMGGKYVRGSPIAKTPDGVTLYSLKNDNRHLFIIDSRSNDLFIDEDAEIPHELLTGVFLDNTYQDNQELVAFCNLLEQWRVQGIDTAVNPSIWDVAVAEHTSAFLSIYLCHDSFLASQTFLGCICKINEEYYFIDPSSIQSSAYTGKERRFQCVSIQKQYYPLIEKYYN